MKHRYKIGTLIAAVMMAGTSAASITYPTTTVYVGGQKVGSAHGNAFLTHTNGSRVVVKGSSIDYRSGGESVYWNARLYDTSGSCISSDFTSCTQQFFFQSHLRGRNFNSNTWQSSEASTPIDPTAKAGRVGFQACVDKRFQLDPCSTPNYTSQVIKYVR